ncbi:hypothetical protein ABAC460_05390 [Asticcacaulis sp. AC460]|nr:hypothetical protein ABAC460_05390 [Asticcacaulis sp. AC460]
MGAETVLLGEGRRPHARMALGEEGRAVQVALLVRHPVAAAEDFEVETVEIVFVRMFAQQVVMQARQRWSAVLSRWNRSLRRPGVVGDDDERIGNLHGT